MSVSGIGQVAKGIFARLARDGVEDIIRQTYWSKQVANSYNLPVIWKNRAQMSNIQSPYIVYQVLSDTLIQQTTGTAKNVTVAGQTVSPAGQHVQHRQCQIAFNCFTKVDRENNEDRAYFAAEKVHSAMSNGKLSFSTDTRFITLTRQSDIEASDDEDNFVFTLQYQIDYEVIENMTRQLA